MKASCKVEHEFVLTVRLTEDEAKSLKLCIPVVIRDYMPLYELPDARVILDGIRSVIPDLE